MVKSTMGREILLAAEVNTVSRAKPTYEDRIASDPQVMVGKPVVKGTRIPVELLLKYLAQNPDVDELFGAFPHLELEDVKACPAYARAAVEREYARDGREERSGTHAGHA